MNKNVVGWFEIPVMNMDRAVKFYEAVFGFELSRHLMGPLEMAWFPWIEDATGSPGSLVCHEQYYTPSLQGTLVYFTAPSGNLSIELARVESAGGTILQPKTQISDEYGYMALFTDTEGNRIALHSRQ